MLGFTALANASVNTVSAFSIFEQIYALVHSLKGVSKILGASEKEAKFIGKFSDALSALLRDNRAIPEQDFHKVTDALDEMLDSAPAKIAKDTLAWLHERAEAFPEHAERLLQNPEFPTPVSEVISKKVFIARTLGLEIVQVSADCPLLEFPAWLETLKEQVHSLQGSLNSWIHASPQIDTKNSGLVKAHAWLCLPKTEWVFFQRELVLRVRNIEITLLSPKKIRQ